MGEKKTAGAAEGRSPDYGEKERDTENKQAGIAQEKLFPQSNGKKRAGITNYYKQLSTKSEVLEVRAISGVMPGGLGSALVWKWLETWEQAASSEDPLGHTGRNSSPAWSSFGRGSTASPEAKELWCQHATLFPSMGTKTLAEGNKTWCWLLAAVYHKL